MRNTFANALYKQMKSNKDVWLLVGDLGWGIFDRHFEDFPKRTKNMGVAEQNMIGVAAGLAHAGKIVFVYSITPFLLYRPFEFIRNLISHDRANVKLVGSGRGRDYKHLGFTHWCTRDKTLMRTVFPNIQGFWPTTKGLVQAFTNRVIKLEGPCYINLTRK